MTLRHACLLCLFVLVAAAPAAADELPLGMTFADETSSDSQARYTFTAEETGVLSIVVRADQDVRIVVYDSFEQELPDGNVDTDFRGDYGAEQGAFVIGQPGEFTVVIVPLSSEASYTMGASWLAMEEVETPEDPQGRPATAAELTLDENLFGVIDEPDGDILDWFKFTAPADGTLTVGTRTRTGDVVLSCYEEGSYNNPIEYSDQDLQGDGGRERIVIEVEEGEVFYFQVRAYGSQAEYAVRGVLETDAPLEEAGEDDVDDIEDAAEDAAEEVDEAIDDLLDEVDGEARNRANDGSAE